MLLHVHGKGSHDRYLPLQDATLLMLRDFWRTHRSAEWLFPRKVLLLDYPRPPVLLEEPSHAGDRERTLHEKRVPDDRVPVEELDCVERAEDLLPSSAMLRRAPPCSAVLRHAPGHAGDPSDSVRGS
jgi:hypothetical protein